MSLFWTVRTCRRFRRQGLLTRYAESGSGRLTAAERDEVEAHLAQCPSCAVEMADLQTVGALLQATRPVDPPSLPGSLAVRGELWSRLRPEIDRTPQDVPIRSVLRAADPDSDDATTRIPRLERVGSFLSMPRPLPFAFAAACGFGILAVSTHFARHGGSAPGNVVVSAADSNRRPIELTMIESKSPAGPLRTAVAGSVSHDTSYARVDANPMWRVSNATDGGGAGYSVAENSAVDSTLATVSTPVWRRPAPAAPPARPEAASIPHLAGPPEMVAFAGSAPRDSVVAGALAVTDAAAPGATVDAVASAATTTLASAAPAAQGAGQPEASTATASDASGVVAATVASPTGGVVVNDLRIAADAPAASGPVLSAPPMTIAAAAALGTDALSTGRPVYVFDSNGAAGVDSQVTVATAGATTAGVTISATSAISDGPDAADIRAVSDIATTLRRRRTLFLYANR